MLDGFLEIGGDVLDDLQENRDINTVMANADCLLDRLVSLVPDIPDELEIQIKQAIKDT